MKRFSVLLLAALFLLPACTNEIRTERLTLEEEVPFHEGSQFHLSLHFDVAFPTSGFDGNALAEARKTIRTQCFGDAFVDFTAPLPELAQTVRDMQAEDYVLQNEDFLREMEITEEEANNLNWELEIQGEFGEKYDNYINYVIDRSSYFGGAHGLFALTPIVMDMSTGRAVSDEVFLRGISRERLIELIDIHKFDDLMDELKDGFREEDVFYVDTIEPSPYFSVDEEGITYYYQPYDVAPYVFGVIQIEIPWSDLP